MSFGKSKNNGKAEKAAKPTSFYTPFGNVVNGTFTPIETNGQVNTRNLTLSKLEQIVGGMPTSYSVNDAYNNPFYNTMLDYTRQPINQQRQQEFSELDNTLSARNQLGSSYDAYQKYLTNQRYDTQYRQAENQARLTSADAYQQAFSNSLSALQGLRNDYNSAMEMMYRPATLAMSYQNAVSPLQTSMVNYYSDLNRNATTEKVAWINFGGDVAKAIGQAIPG